MKRHALALLGAHVCPICLTEFPSAGTLRAHQRDVCGGEVRRGPAPRPARFEEPDHDRPRLRKAHSDHMPTGQLRMLVPGSFGKCSGPRGCGATLRTLLDAQLHFCDPLLTSRAAMAEPEVFYGRLTRSSLL